MAKAGTKDFRMQMDGRLYDALEAIGIVTGKKPAVIVNEALAAYLDIIPRLERAAEGIENAYADKNAIAILTNTVVDYLDGIKDLEAQRLAYALPDEER